jgi:glycosyltransferase involved in cell wall biosynthesis
MKNVSLSIIVPLYNEEDNVNILYESIVKSIDPLNLIYEILFVDDGSKDSTFSRAREIAQKNQRLRVIKFRKNYGQTSAMAAGIAHAQGEILVTMDGDLQNDPEDIPEFIKLIEGGSDIVCGWRHKRQDKLVTRKIPSIIANWIIGKITGVPIKDNGCSLKAYRADIIKSIPLYSDMHRFIPAMSSMAGTSVVQLKVRHHPRKFGVSKYGITRIYKVIVDLLAIKTILSFASKPLHLFAIGGFVSMVFGVTMFLLSIDGIYEGRVSIDFMFASGALLLVILSFFLIVVGLLCELIQSTGNFIELSELKTTVE